MYHWALIIDNQHLMQIRTFHISAFPEYTLLSHPTLPSQTHFFILPNLSTIFASEVLRTIVLEAEKEKNV